MTTDMRTRIESELETWSENLTPEARYYWERHRPRYRYLQRLLGELAEKHSFERILDVGMSFQTVWLSKQFPESRVDCLGVNEDHRFRPLREFSFHKVDLNDAATETEVKKACHEEFDLIVFMEVLEHLYTPPEIVLRYLKSLLRSGGIIILTTPNAAWLKNRIKMVSGRNPFEMLRADRTDMGHIREYTAPELDGIVRRAGLSRLTLERRGLYQFEAFKDNCYNFVAEWTHPSLRRTCVAVCQKNQP